MVVGLIFETGSHTTQAGLELSPCVGEDDLDLELNNISVVIRIIKK